MPKLEKQNKAYLNIEIDDKTYQIPLARSLKVKDVRKLMKVGSLDESSQFELMCEIFGQYIGNEIIDEMTESDLEQLFTLWTKANKEVGELSMGES